MAHVSKPRGKNGRVAVQVRRAGHAPVFRTFAKASAANDWAKDMEAKIETGSAVDHKALGKMLVRDFLIKFRDEEVPKRKGWRWETNRINCYLAESWSWLSTRQDVAGALRKWRDKRLTAVTPQTVNRDFNLLGSVYTHARKEWGIPVENPVHQVKRPTVVGGKRDVVWSDAEFEEFISHIGFDMTVKPESAEDYVPWVMVLLRHTGLRLGSLCSTRIDQLHLDVPMIGFDHDQVKNGEPFDCPIGSRAVEVFEKLKAHRPNDRVLIPFSPDLIGNHYRDARAAVEAEFPTRRRGLRLHDLRHTWTTKVVESGKVPTVLELMKITGRKDMKSLAIYYNPTAQTLAKMLD